MKQKKLGLIIMVLAAITFGLGAILMKLLLDSTGLFPGHIAVWRFAITAPLIWLVYLVRGSSDRLVPEHPWRFLGLGVVFSLASFSALFALERLPSSLYVIILYIYPSMVSVYSLVTGRTVPKLLWIGLPLTFIGLVLTAYDFNATVAIDFVGFLITLFNAFAVAAYMILSEKVFNGVSERLLGTNWVMTGAMIFGLLMIPVFGVRFPETARGWALLLSLGIFGTLIPILAMNISLQLLGAARGSVIVTLQPVTTILISTLFLGETLSLQQWLGGALVIVAILLLHLSADRKGRKEPVSGHA